MHAFQCSTFYGTLAVVLFYKSGPVKSITNNVGEREDLKSDRAHNDQMILTNEEYKGDQTKYLEPSESRQKRLFIATKRHHNSFNPSGQDGYGYIPPPTEEYYEPPVDHGYGDDYYGEHHQPYEEKYPIIPYSYDYKEPSRGTFLHSLPSPYAYKTLLALKGFLIPLAGAALVGAAAALTSHPVLLQLGTINKGRRRRRRRIIP